MSLFPPDESSLARMIREAQEKEARNARLRALFSKGLTPLTAKPTFLGGLTPGPIPTLVKRKVFISYHHADDKEARSFLQRWAIREKVFTPKGIGFRFTDDIIDSDNPSYVMSQIREKYLGDSSVTIVLLGKCTHSRRYVDWEIKTSLRQGIGYTPNGLLGIILPSQGGSVVLPPRFKDNWTKGHVSCYARFYVAPTSASELRNWIEDAYRARTSRAQYIQNSSDMMKYNAQCNVCKITH